MISNKWEQTKLDTVCERVSVGYVGITTPYFCDAAAGIPLIRSQNVRPGKLDLTDVKYVTPEFHEKTQKSRLLAGDVLFVRVGQNRGDCCVLPEGLGELNCANIVFARPRPHLSKFLSYFFRSPFGQHILLSVSTGSAQGVLNTRAIADLKIPLPSPDEAKEIADVLSSLDEKIDLLQRQNKTLEVLAQTLFRHWFVDGAEDDWEEGVIPDEFVFTMGLSPPGSSYNENGEGVPMFQGNADFGFRFPQNRVYTTDPRRFAEQYDTLISVRAPVGAQNMAHERCCIGRGVAAFRYKPDISFYTYAYFKLWSLMDGIKQFDEEGTVFGAIGKQDFMEFKITIPPADLVRQFQEIAKPLDDKVIANCREFQTLEKLRDTLLPKLMSGEVRMRL